MLLCGSWYTSLKVHRLIFFSSALLPPHETVFLTAAWLSYCCAKRKIQSHIATAKKQGTLIKEWENALSRSFDLVDNDGSGSVDIEELSHLLHIVDGAAGSEPTEAERAEATKLMTKWQTQGKTPTGLSTTELSKHTFLIQIAKENRFIDSEQKQIELIQFSRGSSNFGTRFGFAFQMLFLVHSPISQTAFQWIDCRPVGETWYMHVDYSMDCDSAEYHGLSPLAWTVIVVFSVGMPLLLGIFLFRERKTLRTPVTVSKIGWMYSRYTLGSEWWDVHEVIRKLFLTGVLLVFRDPIMQIPIAIGIQLFSLTFLDRFHPHKSKLVFAIALIAYCATLMKYVSALQLQALSGATDAVQLQVGWWLVAMDVIVLFAAVVAMLLLSVFVCKKLNEAEAAVSNAMEHDVALEARRSSVKVVPLVPATTRVSSEDAQNWAGPAEEKATVQRPEVPLRNKDELEVSSNTRRQSRRSSRAPPPTLC